MIYNSGNKGSAATAIKNAINKLNSCKSVQINIPSDFVEAGTIKSALNIIKNISLKGVKGEFENAVADFEAAEKATEGSIIEFMDLLGGFGKNLLSKKDEILKNMIEVTDMKNALKNRVKNNYDDLDENVKKEMINSINIINLDNVIKSGIPVDEYEKRLINAFDNVSVYCNTQRKQLNEQGIEITDKEIDIETENTREYLKNVRETTTYIKDGVIYVNLDGTPTKLPPEMFLEAVKDTQEYILENSSSHGGDFYYGNSGTLLPGQIQNSNCNGNAGYHYPAEYIKLVSCDRLIAMAFNRLGLYDDQNVGGDNMVTEDYLSTHGFEKVEDKTDIKPGDIIIIQNSRGKWCHTYVIESYDDKTKLCSKYDMGKNERVNHVQPYRDVPIVEEAWENKGESLKAIYRIKQ